MSSMKRDKIKEFSTLSKTLLELRQANGFTQADIALKLNITYQSYQAYERGVAVPTLHNFIKIADLYDVSLDYLIGRKDL